MLGAAFVSIALYFCHPRPVNGYVLPEDLPHQGQQAGLLLLWDLQPCKKLSRA
jgi:hypothetical protein